MLAKLDTETASNELGISSSEMSTAYRKSNFAGLEAWPCFLYVVGGC